MGTSCNLNFDLILESTIEMLCLFFGLGPRLMLPDLGFHDRRIWVVDWVARLFYLQHRHHVVRGLPLWDGRGVKDSVFGLLCAMVI
jgi:hypothetical protein